MSNLSEAQIKSLVFNAVGRGAETNIFSPFQLSWAGNDRSGLSLGFMQWDFGQRLSASATNTLLNSFNAWANVAGVPNFANEAALKIFIGQTGDAARTAQGSVTAKNLNKYFETATGRAYVAALEDKSFTGAPGILGIKPFADRVLATAFVQGLNDTDTRIVLAGMLDVFNRSPAMAEKAFGKLSTPNLTAGTFRSNVIDAMPGDFPGPANKAIETAILINKLETEQSFIGQAWRSLPDQTMRGVPTVDAQVLDAMMRDPIGAGKVLARLGEGGSGQPVVLLSGIGQGRSIWREAPFVGVDKDGNLRVVGGDGVGYVRTSSGTSWAQTQSTDPNSDQYFPKIEWKNQQWKFRLSDGSDFTLGDSAIAQVKINGATVTLDANKPGQYAFMEDGVLVHAAFSADMAVESGQVLTGQFAGSTYVRDWREGNPNLKLGFGANTATLSAQLNTLTTFTDGAGKTIEIDSLPVKTSVDGQLIVNGARNITTTKQNGIVQSVVQNIDSIDPHTNNRELSRDTVLNSVAGQFISHTKSSTVTTGSGEFLNKLDITYNAQNQIAETKLSESQSDSSLLITVRDGQGVALSTTRNQTFDDGSTLDIKTDHISGLDSIKATNALNVTREATLPSTAALTPAQQEARLTDHLYSGATSFFNALRTGDKLGQLLSMGQMVSSFAKINGGNTAQFDSFLGGATAGLGILSALNGLQSTDLKTQLNSAANLLRSADTLATLNGSSFLSAGASQALSQFGAVLSIANLGNVGQMLENGQLGTAIATTVNAINAGAFLAGAGGATSAFGAGAFIPMDPTTLLVFVVATAILDEAFKKTPPPPPPVGQATLKTLANGSVGYDISNAANGGAELLTEKMNALVAQINAQLDYANGKVLTQAQQTLLELTPAQVAALPNRPIPAADQMLTLVASRAPKIYIQSWPAHAPANLSTNYFFGLESKHPQTGQSYNVGLARQDLVRHYAEALVHPQALVAQWEVTHLTAKYGSNQTLWKTEGQWASGLSAIEAERLIKQAAVTAAQGALANAQKTTLTQGAFVGEGEITGNTFVQSLPDTAAVQAAQAALAAAQGARAAFEAENPGKLDPFNDKQGSNPQAAAHIVDAATIAAAKNNPANEALQNALIAARTGAAHQWVKVIALDWGGDGITKQTLPGSVSQTLQAVQTDGVARFDVDNDGYREATEWLAPSEAILGLDRDNNGALDTANELFNGVNTPFAWAGCSRREPARCKRSRQSKVGKSCKLSKTKQFHKYKTVFVYI